MRRVRETRRFRQDRKRASKRGKDLEALIRIVWRISEGRALAVRHHEHRLAGNYTGCRECHIEPDWLLIYQVEEDEVVLVRTGTHADLFQS